MLNKAFSPARDYKREARDQNVSDVGGGVNDHRRYFNHGGIWLGLFLLIQHCVNE